MEQNAAEPLYEEAAPKKKGKGKIVAITSVIVVLVAAVAVYFIVFFNPYNHLGYTNVTGRTIGEIAEESGMTLEEFLAQYELPANMKANTTEAAAFYSIPTKIMAQMYGMDFETLKSSLQLGDEITEDTPWGEAEGSIKLSVYVGGEEELNEFKQEYGLGDDITGDTQWKDVRKVVEKKSLEAAQATEAPVEETGAPAETAAVTDAPAETAAAEDTAATQAPAEGQPAA